MSKYHNRKTTIATGLNKWLAVRVPSGSVAWRRHKCVALEGLHHAMD